MEFIEVKRPHGFLIWKGKQTAIGSDVEHSIDEPLVLVSDGEAFGSVILSQPSEMTIGEFDKADWCKEHKVFKEERRLWWPDAEILKVYRIKEFIPYEQLKLVSIKNNDLIFKEVEELTGDLLDKSKRLPKTVLILEDALQINPDLDRIKIQGIDPNHYDIITNVLRAVFNIKSIKRVKELKESISLYSLALVRNPKPTIEKAKEDAPNYRKSEFEDRFCKNCNFNDDGFCTLFEFNFDNGFVCDAWELKKNMKDNTMDEEIKLGEKIKLAKDVLDLVSPEIEIQEQSEEEEIKQFDGSEWDGDAANWETAGGYCSDSLIDVNPEGEDKTKDLCKLPFRKPESDEPNINAIEAIAGGNGISALVKPDGVEQGEWDLQVLAAANWIIDVYPEALGREAPPSVLEIAGIEIPEEETVEENAVSETIELEIKMDNWTTKLSKKLDKVLNYFKEKDTKEESPLWGFLIKEVDAESWIFTYSTNSYLDRDKEAFSLKGLEKFVEQNLENKELGFFNFWHIEGTDFAEKKWQGVVGKFLVEGGPFLENEAGPKAKEFLIRFDKGHIEIAPEGWGCSPEFKFLPEERAEKIYDNFHIVRTSVLPKFAAANIWTGKEVIDVALDGERRIAAEAMFGKEFVANLIQQGEQRTDELDEQGIESKGVGEETAEEIVEDAVETSTSDNKEEPIEEEKKPLDYTIEEVAEMVGNKINLDFQPVAEALVQLQDQVTGVVKEVTDIKSKQAMELENEIPRFTLQTLMASKAEDSILDDNDDLKDKKPAAKKHTSGSAADAYFMSK